jgi:hypothetical protein
MSYERQDLFTIRQLLGSLPCFGVVCIAHLLTIRELLGSLPVFGVVCIAHLLTIREKSTPKHRE